MRQTTALSLLMLLLLCGNAKAQEEVIGKWEGHSPDGDRISYEFKEDNSVTWNLDKPGFPGPVTARYSVDYSTKPIQIDMFEFSFESLKGVRFIGIVEFISPKKIKIDGTRIQADSKEERPKEFTYQAVEFSRIE